MYSHITTAGRAFSDFFTINFFMIPGTRSEGDILISRKANMIMHRANLLTGLGCKIYQIATPVIAII